ncbi:MAG: hypothetical protein K2F79_06860 [Muribaculaceae bacterium]|nr:hypothetical protein [Muribaculaceae bacterium]
MLGGSAAMAAPVQKIIPDTYAAGLSPNGKWGVSSVYELMTVTDFTSGQSYDFPGEATPGLGNCITDDGVLVGSARDNAIIFIDGEFRSFDEALSLKYTMSLLNAITPDAKYAVGILSNTEPNSLTYVPALWELNADGTPKSMELLP